jgi:predicted metal-binding protein
MDKWIELSKKCGFTEAVVLNVETLRPVPMVRDACAEGKCGAYGKNWTCPPYCGDLEECEAKIREYNRGLLLQTVGKLEKTVDTRGYARAEREHLEALHRFAEELRKSFPNALCLGSGGCRICGKCAWPEPCRFPERACASMEAYGLFVTQVCRDNKMAYHHGPKTITYTACVLF